MLIHSHGADSGVLLAIWWIAIRDNADRVVNIVVPIGAIIVLLDPLIPIPITLTAGIMVVIVTVLVIRPPVEKRLTSGQ